MENDIDNAAKAYQSGDYAAVAKFMKQACDWGNASGCYNLGVLYANGQGDVRQNKSTTKEY